MRARDLYKEEKNKSPQTARVKANLNVLNEAQLRLGELKFLAIVRRGAGDAREKRKSKRASMADTNESRTLRPHSASLLARACKTFANDQRFS